MFFQSHGWEVYTPDNDNKKQRRNNDKLEIFSWCLSNESVSYLIRVQNFIPYLLMKVSTETSDQQVEDIYQKLCMDYRNVRPISYNVTFRKKLYYDREQYTKFMELNFDSEVSRSKFHYYANGKLLDDDTKIKLYEFDIKPVRQMLTKINLKYTEWFTADFKEPKIKTLNCHKDEDGNSSVENQTHELICDYKSIRKVSVPLTITKPMTLSWDIETYSDNHKKMPNSLYSKHVITMISVITQRMSIPDTRRKFLITFLQINDFEGTEVCRCKDEIDMIYVFFDLINYINPEVILGYNIFLYDFPYLINRLDIKNKPLLNIGMLEKVMTSKREINWESSAYGIQKLQFLQMNGRDIMDMYTIISRDYKFPNYKLDTVAKELLGRTKHDVTAVQMFKAYENILKDPNPENINEMTRVAKYCIQDSDLVVDLFEKLNTWIGMIELSSIAGVNTFDLFTRGQQCRCVSLIYDIARNKQYVMSTRKIGMKKFKGALVREPVVGIHDFVATLDFKSMYPSIIIKDNMCFTTLIRDEDIDNYTEDEYNKIDCEIEGTIKSIYFSKRRIGILPELEKYLISERTSVREEQKKYEKNSVEWLVLEMRQNGLKVLCNSIFGFAGAESGKYKCPEVATAITARGRELNEICNQYLVKNYDVKMIYGDTDSVIFSAPHITNYKDAWVYGKQMEKEVSAQFEDPLFTELEKVGRVLIIKKKKYLYWKMDPKTGFLEHKLHFKGDPEYLKIAEWKLDEENRYKDQTQVINGHEVSRIVEPILMSKGVDTARRDKCKFQTDIFTLVTNQLLKRNSFEEVYETIFEYVKNALQRNVPFENFIITKKVGKKSYKQEGNAMRVFVGYLKSRGIIVEPGERIEYVIVKTDSKRDKCSKKMKLPEHFKEDGDTIDVEYYLNKYVGKTIEYLFRICYPDEISKLDSTFNERIYAKKIERLTEDVQSIYEDANDNTKRLMNEAWETSKNIDEGLNKLVNIKGLKGKIVAIGREYNREVPRYSLSGSPVTNTLKLVELKKYINHELITKYRQMNPKLK